MKKKNIILLSEIAKKVITTKKSRRLFENVQGLASSVQNKVMELGKEVKAAGEDITDEEVQAAMLMAALEDNGNLDKVDVQDVETIAQQIQEARGYRLKEAGGGGLLQTVELVGAALGNVALLNVIAGTMKELTGKEINPDQISQKINKAMGPLKKLTGLPAKAMEKFFEFVTKKLGGGKASQKIAGYSGTIVIVTILLALGLLFFPVLGASPLMVFLSLTGVIGKGFELATLWKHLIEAIKNYKQEGGEGAETLPNLQPA
jgi:hypothetical protein